MNLCVAIMSQKTVVAISTDGRTVNVADSSVFFQFLHNKETVEPKFSYLSC